MKRILACIIALLIGCADTTDEAPNVRNYVLRAHCASEADCGGSTCVLGPWLGPIGYCMSSPEYRWCTIDTGDIGAQNANACESDEIFALCQPDPSPDVMEQCRGVDVPSTRYFLRACCLKSMFGL